MITQVLTAVFGTKNARDVRRYRGIVARINQLEESMLSLSDDQLRSKTTEFKNRLSQGERLDNLIPESFAAVREAGRRALGMRHYDVQLIGGLALHEGKIAEMKTGEGKTLVATLPLYLNALTGRGAHLVTVNDYLAKRDGEWNKPLYEALGLTIGILQNESSTNDRKKAYDADITYGTNSQFGFDYLRDNMKFNLADYVQRELHYAIVDEVDSILIDEARTPLIISGASDKGADLYMAANQAVKRLRSNDYEIDFKARSVSLTESGVDALESFFSVPNLYAPESMVLLHHISQALKAHTLFKNDVDYIVANGEVLIVDEHTGRVLHGRRYSDGLHQALEAKEGVVIEEENQTLATITLQNFFRMYKKLSGMTGTAATEAEEFYRTYKLEVVSIPTHRPVARVDEGDAIFLSEQDKFKAVIEDIIESHKKGQPVLVGTASVEKSEELSELLRRQGLPHNVLNAKQNQREAEIIAEAGQLGKITIATNMAGRGTDIKLGPGVKEVGGLRIVGSERHESRRIDNQLRGRAGRQGDPGSSKFYISLEDTLIKIFAGDRLKKTMESLPFGMAMKEGERIEHPLISKNIEAAQEQIERHHFDARKNVLEYDDVLNQQRTVIYSYRREILEGGHFTQEIITEMMRDTIEYIVQSHITSEHFSPDQKHELAESLSRTTGIAVAEFESILQSVVKEAHLIDEVTEFFVARYQKVRAQIEPTIIEEAEKWTLLEVVDHHWKTHLQVLDALRDGIWSRSFGQKNPLIEYKKEAFDIFLEMMRAIKFDVTTKLFMIKAEHFSPEAIIRLEQERIDELSDAMAKHIEEPSDTTGQPMKNAPKVGRNDKCPCGSGKKYKQCCGKS